MAKIQHADNIIPLVNALNYLLRAVIHQDNALICLKKNWNMWIIILLLWNIVEVLIFR